MIDKIEDMVYNTEIGVDILHAKQLLDNNEVVAIPTETVYGLAANALQTIAVEKIYAAKNRPQNNPLIVHSANKNNLHNLVTHINSKAQLLIESFMPGPLTLLLPKKDIIPYMVTAGLPDVAIRMPTHPVAVELLQMLDYPLAAPSANPFGYISPTTAGHVFNQLNTRIPYILEGGQCNKGIESTIVGFSEGKPVIYREGAISLEEIETIIGPVAIHIKSTQKLLSPGMTKHHYSPSTPLLYTGDMESVIDEYSQKKIGHLAFDRYSTLLPAKNQIILSHNSNLAEVACNLYAAMHEMDAAGYDVIIVQKFPETGIGRAINDRLKRAATPKYESNNH